MVENFSKKKRRRVKSINDELNLFSQFWSVKTFKSKYDLEQFINNNTYKYRSTEDKTEKQRCRFCLALNPNSQQHMIQVYLNCKNCIKNNLNCSKTNICEIQKKYELLTKHRDLCPLEWIIFDENKPELVLKKNENDAEKEIENCSLIDEDLSEIFLKMNITSQIQSEYNNTGSFYVWIVGDVLPSQKYLFKEIYLIKIKNNWIEFRNGRQKHNFKHISSFSDELILRREDGYIFRLNSQRLYNCEENEVEYEGEWIFDSNKQLPCIECSNEINKMVFECVKHKSDLNSLNNPSENRCWKANIKYDKKYFRRRSLSTWEEYCNDEITDTFKYITFDKNGDLIIQRNSKENPDFLRFTGRELFIGAVKDYIYYPLYTGFWQKENSFKKINSTEFESNKANMINVTFLSDFEIEKYLKLVRKHIFENRIQINGVEDPVILKYADSDNIDKYNEFVRIVNVKKNHYVLCTGSFGTKNDVLIFDCIQIQQIEESLVDQLKKWFSNQTITTYFARTQQQDLKLSAYYSLALMTEYVIKFGQINLFDLENLIFDETKLIEHFFMCIEKQKISCFPIKEYSNEDTDANLIFDVNTMFPSPLPELEQNVLSEERSFCFSE